MVARCKTEGELRIEVTHLLRKYLKSPQVSVRVSKRDSRPPVSIYGEVRGNSQQVNLTRRAFLLELISYAGGVTEKSGGMVHIFPTRPPVCAEPGQEDGRRGQFGEGMNVPSRMYSLAATRQGRDESNPEILPGDIIVVQKVGTGLRYWRSYLRPGALDIPEGGLPLMQAVAMSSGITRAEAKTKEIKIYRRKAGGGPSL